MDIKCIIFDCQGVLIQLDSYKSIMPGAFEIIEKLKNKGYSLAIGSNLSHRGLQEIVERENWQKYFDVYIGIDDVDYAGKPAPDIFLKIARLLQIEPRFCAVIDDSVSGIEAAKAAGMYAIRFGRVCEVADEFIVDFYDGRLEGILS